MSAGYVTTYTLMSVSDSQGTITLTSKVVESTDSALEHLRAMGEGRGEPVYVSGQAGWRWTWEYVTEFGLRCTDTVRMV